MQFILCILLCASVHQALADKCSEYGDNLPDGNYAWCGSCTEYLACTDGKARVMPCPDGLEYDMGQDECIRARDSHCDSGDDEWNPCDPDADLCDHGECSMNSSSFHCDCDDGWKGEYCDSLIVPCRSKPTKYTLEVGQDIVTYFPDHGECSNKEKITKAFCKGDCDKGKVCTESDMIRKRYNLNCTDGFAFSTRFTFARECACVAEGGSACQLEDVTRKRGYFRFFVGDITYINTDPVPMHECGGSCSPESRCKPNEFSPVILTLTAKANKGGTLNVQVMDPSACWCNFA